MAKLYFRYGAMNCGKTTNILQTFHNYVERGMKPILLKPAIDTKAHDRIQSRLGIEQDVDLLINTDDSIVKLLQKLQNTHESINVVIVDEAQFLKKEHIDELFEIAVLWDIPVLCYGLRTDFQTHAFTGSARLMEIAHSIEEMKTICRCGRKAILNARMVDGMFVSEGDQVAIDGEVDYESLCGYCYVNKVGTVQ